MTTWRNREKNVVVRVLNSRLLVRVRLGTPFKCRVKNAEWKSPVTLAYQHSTLCVLHSSFKQRVWFNSRIWPCQGRDDGATPSTCSNLVGNGVLESWSAGLLSADLRLTPTISMRGPEFGNAPTWSTSTKGMVLAQVVQVCCPLLQSGLYPLNSQDTSE